MTRITTKSVVPAALRPLDRPTRGGSAVGPLLGLCLALVTACVSPTPAPAPPPPGTSSGWRSMPLSWEKLEALEDYLDSSAAAADPASRLEAELELSEGRLTFARRERAHSSSQTTALRLRRAEGGFERVKGDRFASSAQRYRASRGLAAVTAERGAAEASTALPGGGIVRRSAWGAQPPDPRRLTPHRGAWSRITVHHSADTNDIVGIQRYHMRTNRFGDIGYHYVVDAGGRVYEGRSLTWQGAHAGGTNNPGNLGVCVLGDYSQGRPGAATLKSLEKLIGTLAQAHGIPDSRIVPHRDLKATDCPGPYLTTWSHDFRQRAPASRVTAGTAGATGSAASSGSAPGRRTGSYRKTGTVR